MLLRRLLEPRNPWLALIWEQVRRYGPIAALAPLGCVMGWMSLWLLYRTNRVSVIDLRDYSGVACYMAVFMLVLVMVQGKGMPLFMRHQMRLPMGMGALTLLVLGTRTALVALTAAVCFGVQWCLIGTNDPALDLMIFLYVFMAIFWCIAALLATYLSRFPKLTALAMFLVAPLVLLAWVWLVYEHGVADKTVMWALLPAMTAGGFEAVILTGRRMRAATSANVPRNRRGFSLNGDLFRRRPRRFASALSAQHWFERCNSSWLFFPVSAAGVTVAYLSSLGHNLEPSVMAEKIMVMTFAQAVGFGALRLIQHLRRRHNRGWRFVATLPVATGTLARAALLRTLDDTLKCIAFSLFLCALPWLLPPDPPALDPLAWRVALTALHCNLNAVVLSTMLLGVLCLWCACSVALMPRWLLIAVVVVFLAITTGMVYDMAFAQWVDHHVDAESLAMVLSPVLFFACWHGYRRAVYMKLMSPVEIGMAAAAWVLLVAAFTPLTALLAAPWETWRYYPLTNYDALNTLYAACLLLLPLLPGASVTEFHRWRHGR